jgi:hypothetical protein
MLRSLGLGGDGDEVDAIHAVEQAFGFGFATEDAEPFESVGDVWAALLDALRLGEAEAAPLWPRFADAIAGGTGVDPAHVDGSTRLLAEPVTDRVTRILRHLFGRH